MSATLHPTSDSKKAEMSVTIRDTSRGRDFTFTLKRNHINVVGGRKPSGGPDSEDWYEWLTREERAQVFNYILAKYRPRALAEGGFQLAALGVTERTHDIYVGVNTEQLSSNYFRQCAEQNMITAVTQADVYEQIKERLRTKQADPNRYEAHKPQLAEMYLMGGRPPRDGDTGVNITCPCGNCTDMLKKVMKPGAPTVILPVNDGSIMPPLVSANSEIKSVIDVPPGSGWDTTVDDLNVDREIELKSEYLKSMQRTGYKEALRRGLKLPEEVAEDAKSRLFKAIQTQKREQNPLLQKVNDVGRFLLHVDINNLWNEMPRAIQSDARRLTGMMMKSAENILLQRESVAELDAAVKSGTGDVDISDLNRFMVDKIHHTLADRLRSMNLGSAKTEDLRQTIEQKVEKIRCVVIRLDDGTFRYAIESHVSETDKAAPSAEMAAVAQATSKLGLHGVSEVWAMEFNPKDINEGKMHTSTKEGVERLLKRQSSRASDMQFHFIPFNSGNLSDDLKIERAAVNRTAKEIFPSYFSGVGNRAIQLALASSGPGTIL